MTTMELAGATRAEVGKIRSAMQDHGLSGEGIRTAMHDHGLTAEGIQAATERVAAAAESHGVEIRDRVVGAARDRAHRGEELRPRRGLPRGVGVMIRTLGLAWAALMVSTLTMALLSRSSSRRLAAIDPEANEIKLRTDLGPMAFHSRATAFRGGVIDCWYGGGFVDLRGATLDPAGAVLRVRAVFGGGQIIVPEGWRVVMRVRGIGGLSDLRPAVERTEEAPVLTVEGIAIFGGFSVESSLSPKVEADLDKAVREMHEAVAEPEALVAV